MFISIPWALNKSPGGGKTLLLFFSIEGLPERFNVESKLTDPLEISRP